MAEPEKIVERYEAGGLTSNHDFQIFLAWRTALPGYTWNRASVSRNDGLVLYYDQDEHTTIELHFANAICGLRCQGAYATRDILLEARFGVADPEELASTLYAYDNCHFTRSM